MRKGFDTWLEHLSDPTASDLYLTVGAPPILRGDGFRPLADTALTDSDLDAVLGDLLTPQQRKVFDDSHEFNMALDGGVGARFRINIFRQRQHPGLVIRRLPTQIPSLADLGLPEHLGALACERRGLIIVVGATGSGKSTTLAAMIGHRNHAAPGHIVTIEDPIEFVHEHARCIVTQREVGVDTASFAIALKNALRQKPDVILIGEIRDAEVMRQAINSAETGHLCLATLHASNSNQAIERILNFFPQAEHEQVLLNLSLNLRGILSQRLVHAASGRRAVAMEILLNHGVVSQYIREANIKELKAAMEANVTMGMATFDHALHDLWSRGVIDEDTALAEADNRTDLQLRIQREKVSSDLGSMDTSHLSV